MAEHGSSLADFWTATIFSVTARGDGYAVKFRIDFIRMSLGGQGRQIAAAEVLTPSEEPIEFVFPHWFIQMRPDEVSTAQILNLFQEFFHNVPFGIVPPAPTELTDDDFYDTPPSKRVSLAEHARRQADSRIIPTPKGNIPDTEIDRAAFDLPPDGSMPPGPDGFGPPELGENENPMAGDLAAGTLGNPNV